MKFISLAIGALLTALFITLLLSLNSTFTQQNNVQNYLADDSSFDNLSSNIDNSLNQVNDPDVVCSDNTTCISAEQQRKNFQNEGKDPKQTALGFFFTSIVTAGNTFINSFTLTFKIVLTFIEETLGIPAVVTGTIVSILAIVSMFAAWRMLRVGE